MTIVRPGHALEGKLVGVFARLKRQGEVLFLVELPDGSRGHIPAAWTDLTAVDDASATLQASVTCIGRLTDFLVLRNLADTLLRRRGESPFDGEEARHADAIEAGLSRRAGMRSMGAATAVGEPSARSAPRGAVKASPPDRTHDGGRSRFAGGDGQ